MKKYILFAGVAALAITAHNIQVQAETTKAVTSQTNTVNPDGSVSYESHTVETKGTGVVATSGKVSTTKVTVSDVKPGPVTFYYYDPKLKGIASANDLTNDIISLWDLNHNNVIDNQEFYSNAMVVYEPLEYSKRTYQDIDADGVPELTKEEYTMRFQQLPSYRNLNKDDKEGLTLYEFTGVGFQDADNNNDNQVSFDELKAAFYAKEGLAPLPKKINE